MSRAKFITAAVIALPLYYAALIACIFYTPHVVSHFTGAAAESGPVYGFWSGFGGTLLFSAAVLSPFWYYQHSCHYSMSCLRWGKYAAAGGTFKLCHMHHPDMMGTRPHKNMIHQIHKDWKTQNNVSSSTA